MEKQIKENLENPEQLEAFYRADKRGFEKAFERIYPQIQDLPIAVFWRIRLENEKATGSRSSAIPKNEIWFLILSCIFAGFLIKIPQILGLETNEYFFYGKNAGLTVFWGLSMYIFLIRKTLEIKNLVVATLVFILSAFYINLLPNNAESDSIKLAFIHLPLMLWCLYGLIYIDFDTTNKLRRIDYIKYNGDLAILVAIILIAGGILTILTFGLFTAINIKIDEFYFNYIVVWGLVAAPIVGTFIIRNYPSVANKIAPVIASIFSPLVLLTLVVYLVFVGVIGKDPFQDRDFLLVFNLLLLGVMAIIVFSVSETSNDSRQRFNEWILLILSVVTLFVDLLALSAILYRLGEYGFTPNRVAVLGSNLLIFGNLLLITIDLFRVNLQNGDIKRVEKRIAAYLPVYMGWTIFMVFVLPFLFGFK